MRDWEDWKRETRRRRGTQRETREQSFSVSLSHLFFFLPERPHVVFDTLWVDGVEQEGKKIKNNRSPSTADVRKDRQGRGRRRERTQLDRIEASVVD